jgi:DNA polymerase III epsilon subunit-like protein
MKRTNRGSNPSIILVLFLLACLGWLLKTGLLWWIVGIAAVIFGLYQWNKWRASTPTDRTGPENQDLRTVENYGDTASWRKRHAGDDIEAFLGKRPKTVVFVDLETNGLTRTDSVLSCSAIKCTVDPISRSMTELGRFSRYYYPKERFNNAAIAVNGLSREEISKRRDGADYPKHFDDDKVFEEFCSGSLRLIAHNAKFDVKFLPFFKGKLFCTMLTNTDIVCTRYLEWKNEYKWPSLSETADYYNIRCDDQKLHGSDYDVEITAQIFRAMLKRVPPR